MITQLLMTKPKGAAKACNKHIHINVEGNVCTFVSGSDGNETPTKKPNMIPTEMVTSTLIVSFGFLANVLKE